MKKKKYVQMWLNTDTTSDGCEVADIMRSKPDYKADYHMIDYKAYLAVRKKLAKAMKKLIKE